EPCEEKFSRTVLESGGARESVADFNIAEPLELSFITTETSLLSTVCRPKIDFIEFSFFLKSVTSRTVLCCRTALRHKFWDT
ncbi:MULTISPECIES: hypothetical protein, partial [unclassified Microcoleus]